MAEPTSILTFSDLILEVAKKLGVAYYGAAGGEIAQIPVDAHDLDMCKDVVNNAVRMVIADAPKPNGWRWLKPTVDLILWPDFAVSSTETLSAAAYNAGANETTLTIGTGSQLFYPSMEDKSLTITGVGTFAVKDYLTSTTLTVKGDADGGGVGTQKTWSIASGGNFTLPRNFSGQVSGQITYAANTNRGVGIEWTTEAAIRSMRADVNDSTGTPWMAAVRIRETTAFSRRRWELLVYNTPSEVLTVQFPYALYFDSLSALTDLTPAPFIHDEVIRSACRAQAEHDIEDQHGIDWEYYRNIALPNAYNADLLSAPKKLGYFGNPGSNRFSRREWNRNWYERPTVTFNS